MRTFLFSLLLATTAVSAPALAQPSDADEDRREAREEREERREARQERRSNRQQAVEQRRERPEARTQRADGNQSRQSIQQQRSDQRDARVEQRRSTREAIGQRQAQRVEQRQEVRQERADQRTQWQQQANQARQRLRPPAGARPDRPAPPVVAESSVPAPRWQGTWRNDRRYDWRRWRDRNRSHFRLGFYFDPFGWGYNRYNVGWRLWPAYYGSQYWLNDPWSYRLPYAPWPYKWVRYYDDALLVNTVTGRVVDVEYNFFW